jgi:transposase
VNQALRCSNTITHRRARIVVLSGAGQRVLQIAAAVGMHPESVRRVIRRVNAGDLMAVLDWEPKQTGRPRTFDDRVARGLVGLLHRAPTEFGFETQRWTLSDLAAAAQQTGLVQRISPDSVSRLVRREGYVWKQAKRHMTSPDPDYDAKKG